LKQLRVGECGAKQHEYTKFFDHNFPFF